MEDRTLLDVGGGIGAIQHELFSRGLREATHVDASTSYLDRVICCYPHPEALLEASAWRTGRVLGLVYPRERFGSRAGMGFLNLWFRIRRSAFRVYLHSPARVERFLEEAGFQRRRTARTLIWRVETYVPTSG